jgi:hypothetical protein
MDFCSGGHLLFVEVCVSGHINNTVIRTIVSLFVAMILFDARLCAQEWAMKMFEVTSHDFGTVARAAKAEYSFEFTNLYLEDVHIARVRTSCGCTTPRIEKDTLKTYEKGAIIAHINSDSFLGNQGATIRVTLDKPLYAEVQLHVKVYVYSNVFLEPPVVSLGTVEQGDAAERTINIRYTGRNDWKILEVKSNNPHLTGAVTETSRRGGRVTYDLKVVLDKNAPTGYVKEYLRLVTNDSQTEQIPVPVDGQIQADISVSPASLFLGVVQPGQSVTKQIVVRGNKPFNITSVSSDCECLQAPIPKGQEPRSLYLVPITFTAGEQIGKITSNVQIETDSGRTALKVPAYAVVNPQ